MPLVRALRSRVRLDRRASGRRWRRRALSCPASAALGDARCQRSPWTSTAPCRAASSRATSPGAPIISSPPVTTGRRCARTAIAHDRRRRRRRLAADDRPRSPARRCRSPGTSVSIRMIEPNDEGDDAADAERAEGRHEDLGHHQGHAEQRCSASAGVVHRQQLQTRYSAEQQRDGADDARQHGAGIERTRRSGRRCRSSNRMNGDVGIGDRREQARAPVGLDASRRVAPGGRKRPRSPPATFTVRPSTLAQQVGDVGGDEVDHVAASASAGRQARGLAHGRLGPVGIAAAQLRQAADVGDGVVDRLCAPSASVRRRGLGAAGLPCRCRPVVACRLRRPTAPPTAGRRRSRPASRRRGWCRRHRGDVAGVKDVGAGARRPRAARARRSVATGTGEARIAWMISRIEVSRPPGVSIAARRAPRPPGAASSRPRMT